MGIFFVHIVYKKPHFCSCIVRARPALPDRALFAALTEPPDPETGMPGLGPSGDDPSRENNEPLAGGSRSGVPPSAALC
jgi:hypothetical protein